MSYVATTLGHFHEIQAGFEHLNLRPDKLHIREEVETREVTSWIRLLEARIGWLTSGRRGQSGHIKPL